MEHTVAIAQRLAVLLGGKIELEAIIEGEKILRVLAEHGAKVADGFVVLPYFGIELGTIVDSGGVVGIEGDGIIVVAKATVVIVGSVAEIGTVDKVFRLFRFQLDEGIHIGGSGFKIAPIGRYLRPHGIGIGRIFGNFQTLGYVLQSLCGVAGVDTYLCHSQVDSLIFFIELEQIAKGGIAGCVLLELELTQRFIEQNRFVVRQTYQHLVVIADSIGIFCAILARHASQAIGVDDKGIALDAERSIGFGTSKVIEIIFCHAAIEIGLCQIGLHLNHLIKILDGKHIIIEGKRISTNAHHLVGVDLRTGKQSLHHNAL